MAAVTFRTNQAALHRLLKGPGPVQLHIANTGRQVEGRYRDCVPEVSGALKRSVYSKLVRSAGSWAVQVGSNLPYASWIEDGKRYDPRSERVIKVKVGPRPCLRDALRGVGLGRSHRL